MIFVVSGPGGVGKGTLVAELVASDPSLRLSRSWTTRPQREGESAGAYTFVDPAAFQQRVDDGGFLEWVEFLGHRYGTPVPEMTGDRDLVLEIELHGAQVVRQLDPAAILILIVPPSIEELRKRLEKRGDSPARIEERISYGQRELETGRKVANEIIVNDDLETAVKALRDIVSKYRAAPS